MFDVWMRILASVPGSVLWLLEDNPAAARNLRREAQARGIDGERLVFAPRVDLTAHLSRHRLADLFLDTLPYNAHTTTSDALWAGLPVLTCLGKAFPGRVAASLLHAVGLPELVTQEIEEYAAQAVELARDRTQLRELRDRLAHNRTRQPLFDTARFCRHLEAAYTQMWKRYQAGLPPESFTVPALVTQT
jgi:predicted O-linked N-acetylglucosamine transferase (SPINDLY family)